MTAPAPKPLEPASGAFTTSTNVRFRWQLTAPATGARLDICGDRACTSVRQTVDTQGDTVTRAISIAAGTTRVLYFRLTGLNGTMPGTDVSPVWPFSVNGLSGASATWGSLHDFDGDGLSDILGAAPSFTQVRLYRGRSPASTTPAIDSTFSSLSLGFGTAVLGLGDLDGDGFEELGIVSTVSLSIYRGSATPFPAMVMSPTWTLTIPSTVVAAAGDVDRDGYADIVVGDSAMTRILLYRGSSTGLVAAPAIITRAEPGFGRSVAGAGDVNGDGYADVVAGATGGALVLAGSSTGLATVTTLAPGMMSMGFGASVACAGDVNGDGYADVIVGAPLDDSAFIYPGAMGGISATATGVLRKPAGEVGSPTKQGEAFGTVVAAAGDLNGDGYSDVTVAAPDVVTGFTGLFVGYVYAFFGRPGGFPVTALGSSTVHQKVIGTSTEVNRRQIARYAGDVNGDGIGDWVVGAPTRNTVGTVEMYLGVAYMPGGPTENLTGGPAVTPTWDIAGTGLGGFGTAVATRRSSRDTEPVDTPHQRHARQR